MHRRDFLLAGVASAARVAGANDRMRGAVIGSGGRGQLLAAEFKEIGVEMAAVCDVYQPHLEAGLKAASSDAKPYHDYRKLLEDSSLDIVIIATPDHLHSQMAIDAVQAGKDVYLEKPMAHTIEEGFRIIDAVRRTKRVVQVGTQRRSSELFQTIKRIVETQPTGDVRLVNAWWYNHQRALRDEKLEGDLDWNQWLGPAARRPPDPLRFFNWYYFWDYSGGMMVGQAAHAVDAIHWMMNSTYPEAVTCAAGRGNIAGAEVPDTTCMCIEYPENYLAVFTVGYRAMRYNMFHDQLTQYNGSKARLDVGREWYALYPQTSGLDLKPSMEERRPGSFGPATRAHIRNFLECVKSRHDPNATVEMGQHTNVVLCLAMESLKSGRRMRYNAAARRVES